MPPPHGVSKIEFPILERTITAYKIWHGYLIHVQKLSRYTLGEKTDHIFTDFIELILRSGYAPREAKEKIVEAASTKLDSLKIFLRIMWELNTLKDKEYADLSSKLLEIGKMLGGWRRELQKRNPAIGRE